MENKSIVTFENPETGDKVILDITVNEDDGTVDCKVDFGEKGAASHDSGLNSGLAMAFMKEIIGMNN